MLLAVVVMTGVADAQEYPPPTPTATPIVEVEACIVIEGEVGNTFVVGQATEQGEVHVSGTKGAAGDEQDVDIFAEPGHVPLGSVPALEDGSFSGTLTLPDSLEPGSYEIATDVASCTETTTLQVLSASGEGGTDVLGAGGTNVDGTDVLGASGENSDGGNLPVTGSDILDLVLLALILLVVGAGIKRWAKRRGRRAVGFGLLKSRPLALPAPSVPHLDTRDFQLSVAVRRSPVEATVSSEPPASSSIRSTWISEGSTSAPDVQEPAPVKPTRKRSTTTRTKSSSPKRKATSRPKPGPNAKA
jgi:hypothetical protein